MNLSICSLYKFGLLLIILSLVAPKVSISGGFNITILDFFPLYFLLYILLIMLNKKKLKLDKRNTKLLVIFLSVAIIMFLSTFHGFFLFQDFLGFIKSISQFYRRFIILILYPLFILISLCNNLNLLNFFSRYFIYSTIITGLLGLSINFIDYIRTFYLNYIASSKQVFLFGLYRNMGFIGEASYFADIIVFSLVLLFIQRNIYSRIKFFIIFVLLILLLVSTVSKSAIISIIISLLIILFIYIINTFLQGKRRFKVDISFASIVLSVFVISIILFFYIKAYTEQILTLAKSSFQQRSQVMWIDFLDIFFKHDSALLFGFGFKGLKSYLGFAGAHNQYLGFLIDFGFIFSAYFFIVFFFLIPIYVYQNISRRYKYFILFIVLYLSTQSFVHEPLYNFQVLGAYICILLVLIHENRYMYAKKLY